MASTHETQALPRLVLIADRFTQPKHAEQTVAAVAAGVRWVQLRDHDADEATFVEAAQALTYRLRAVAPGVHLSVNTRLATAHHLGAGLHLGWRGPSITEARKVLGPEVVLGCSVHNEHEAQAAIAGGADYLFFSPVFPTTSKPGHPGAGVEALRSACALAAGRPVFALGGITPSRARTCRAAGAYGVAVLSGLMEAPHLAEAVDAYQRALSPTNLPAPTCHARSPHHRR